MLKRSIAAFFALVLALLGHAPATQQKTEPVFTGSFLQAWYCVDWDDDRWDAEIAAMKEAGLDKLILQDTAQMDLRGGWTVYYPTELPALRDHGGYGDVIDGALRACRKGGIKVFIGLASFESWWVLGGLFGQYSKVCRVMAEMQREIYARYYPLYPDAFYGWYFTPEISNIPTMKATVPTLARGRISRCRRCSLRCRCGRRCCRPCISETAISFVPRTRSARSGRRNAIFGRSGKCTARRWTAAACGCSFGPTANA